MHQISVEIWYLNLEDKDIVLQQDALFRQSELCYVSQHFQDLAMS